MRKKASCAVILSETQNGQRIVSCGGRISTQTGTAIELYQSATDKAKNQNLIAKVVASGHKTILEHHYFNLAFNNVSVFVEQFLIEFRLAAFTIKSGRYVNFKEAGFNLPNGFSTSQKKAITAHYKEMFALYCHFVDEGIPVEDARFVLPYGIKTNIYMSLNARELIHVICTMVYGRGRAYEEIYNLGLELKAEFDKRYPNLVEKSAAAYACPITISTAKKVEKIKFVSHSCKLLSYPKNAKITINSLSNATKMGDFDIKTAFSCDKAAKLLEHFNYCFHVKNFSMIVLKHYTRHRMQSLSTQPLEQMAMTDRFVMPPTIASRPELAAAFKKAMHQNRQLYNSLLGVPSPLLIYVAPHASAIDFVSTMNARELLHFMNLRLCTRAQWEIRNLAEKMLKLVKAKEPELFSTYGPNCYTYGSCPEGRLCCGKQAKIKAKFDALV